METASRLYKDMAARTGGDIYLGVVGPVRTGKSTFIKRFMDTLVLPHMEEGVRRDRAMDELPQSAAGRTIMTTEPKFIPEQAAQITLDGVSNVRVRLIDCVGYIIPSALGYIEENQPITLSGFGSIPTFDYNKLCCFGYIDFSCAKRIQSFGRNNIHHRNITRIHSCNGYFCRFERTS